MTRHTIRMQTPCPRPDVAFEERGEGRFCLSCREMQHDLRDATEREALALFASHGGKLCGRFRVGPAGELRFRAEKPAAAPNLVRGALLALTLGACEHEPDATVVPEATPATPPPPTSDEAPLAIELPPPPPTSLAEAPPTTVATPPSDDETDTTSGASSEPDHETDQSLDPAHHRQHWHQHDAVHIRHREIHGGARAFPPGHPDDPLVDL